MDRITFNHLGDRTFQTFVNGTPIKGLINIDLERFEGSVWSAKLTVDIFDDTIETIKYLEEICSISQYQFPVDTIPTASFLLDLDAENAYECLAFLRGRKYRHRPCFDTFDHELRKLCDLYGVKALLTHANGEARGLTLVDAESISLSDETLDHRFNIKLDAKQLLTLIGGREINISS